MELIISKFLINYKFICPTDELTINEVIYKKSIIKPKNWKLNLELDRTICQMLRYVNVLTLYKNQNIITIILDYANNATLKLSDYKNAREKWLNYIENDNNKNWKRSIFDISKKEISINILNNINLKPFIFIKELQNEIMKNNNIETDKEIILNLLLEITYYIYRLNEKLYEYENENENQN